MQVLLDRKDRMSMANGLEVRVPFCDYRITEYAYNIQIKAYQERKGIVRYAVQDHFHMMWYGVKITISENA